MSRSYQNPRNNMEPSNNEKHQFGVGRLRVRHATILNTFTKDWDQLYTHYTQKELQRKQTKKKKALPGSHCW